MSHMISDTEQAKIPRDERGTSFGAAAGDYDRYRVGLPGAVVERILPAGVGAVLDLGAGTGAMTRRLVELVERVYAVDPDPRMTELLADRCPEVEVRQGTGENVPLPDDCVDAVVVASAWHWMDPDRTVPEMVRVLRPGGALCLVWNRWDRAVPWVGELEARRLEIIGSDDWVVDRIKHYLGEPWLPAGTPLADVEISSLPWTAPMTKDQLIGSLTTYHHFITASPEGKAEMLRQLTEYVDGDDRIFADADEGEYADEDAPVVHVPMVCSLWRATAA
jgi:SAM-dependent methyltransferase